MKKGWDGLTNFIHAEVAPIKAGKRFDFQVVQIMHSRNEVIQPRGVMGDCSPLLDYLMGGLCARVATPPSIPLHSTRYDPTNITNDPQ